MKTTTWLIAGALALVGCSEKKGDKPAETTGDKPGTAEVAKQTPADMDRPPPEPKKDAKLEPNVFDPSKVPAGIEVKGKKLDKGLRFTDTNGDNWVVFGRMEGTKKEMTSAYLYAKHVAVGGGGELKELRDVRDKVEDCEFDLSLDLIEASLGVTDLDGDAIGEVSFAYQLGCRSDMSPIDLKLLMLEGGDKYILRGETVIKDPDGIIGGKFKVDPSFAKGPPEFLGHAKKLWKKIL